MWPRSSRWASGLISNLLARIAGGVLWIAAALAVLLSLDRLFQSDFEDGSLDLMALSPLLARSNGHLRRSPRTGSRQVLPLTALSPLLGLLFGLPAQAYPALVLSLLIGTPAISAIGAIGASLTLSIRRGGLILPLIVLAVARTRRHFRSGKCACRS